ncbi:hypothetical protein HZC07_01610 [Candidatus Micrarchaeota archaeon]|nr:hypothetical protein [Candidatus Micrarchaeota archaeon]
MKWLSILALLVIFQTAFAASPIDLTFAVPLVAITVIILIALTKMMAEATSNPQLEAWTKNEIREFIAGIIIITIVIVYFISSTKVLSDIGGTGNQNPITVAQGIVDSWLTVYDGSFQNIIRATNKLRIAATFAPYISVPAWFLSGTYSSSPLSGLAIFFGPLNLASQGLTNVIYLFEGIRLLIAYLSITVPKILLPLAFCLRLIPFTRKIGNTLIAIGIAAIVFLPASVIIADSLNKTLGTGFPNPIVYSL